MSSSLARHSGTFDTISVIVIVCSTLGLYNALELVLLIFTTFKQYRGLYFWSLLIASFGIIPYTVGWLVVYFNLAHNYVGFIIDSYGWATMVTGQSVVLYSRLHLVLRNPTILRAVKWMIIVDAFVFHISTTIVLFGSNLGHKQTQFSAAYHVIERVQMTGFCVQEFVISGLYLWKTVELLKIVSKQGTRRVMLQLFLVNVIIIAMDIALLALEYGDHGTLEQAFKVVIYSVKLKLEFAILGKLVEIVQSNNRSNSLADALDYVDETRRAVSTDTTCVASSAKRNDSYSKPKWLDNLDKSTVEHVEHIEKYSGSSENDSDNPWVTSVKLEPEKVQLRNADAITHAPEPAGRKERGGSDVMYAEAMRSISQG